jgi:acetyl esterase/lipase
MSVRAELLRLALRLLKGWHSRKYVPIATARRRLKRIEAFVPRPPAGTQTTAIDAGGVNAVRVAVRQARSDRCVLYFHGGAYAIGTAKLLPRSISYAMKVLRCRPPQSRFRPGPTSR